MLLKFLNLFRCFLSINEKMRRLNLQTITIDKTMTIKGSGIEQQTQPNVTFVSFVTFSIVNAR